MQNIYRETTPTEKSGVFTRQVIYYENGKYTFSCYPIGGIEKSKDTLSSGGSVHIATIKNGKIIDLTKTI